MRRGRWAPWLLLAALACGQGPLEDRWIVVEAQHLDDAGADATWRENGEARRVRLRTDRVRPPWTRLVVEDAAGEKTLAWLVVGPPAAVLLQHAASRQAGLRDHVLPSRLASVETAGQTAELALVLDADALPSQRRSAALADLEADAAARVLAAAEALGAWDVLARGRLPLRDDGTPFLPRFVPRAPGAWRDLRGTALEGFLPAPLAARVARDPALRQASYRELRRLAHETPELAARVGALADALPDRVPRDGVESLQALLADSAEAYDSYLDSVWVEHIVTLRSQDEAEIALYVHTLVPVRLEGFAAPLPRRMALFEKNAIAALRLHDPETGRAVAARTWRDRLLLPAKRSVEPVASGPYRFRTTRLRFRIDGLGASEALRLHLLDALRPVVTRADSGRAIEPSHVQHLSAISDPRFGAEGDEDLDAFASALPRRLIGDGAALTPEALTLRAGAYELREDLLLPPGVGLRLEPGVDLSVQPGRSILVRGPLRIEGTAAQPVRIHGATDAPWGVLAAQGRTGSVDGAVPAALIRYLELEGGSEDQIRGAYYSGQLSIYHQDLRLEHATLRHSHADDSLNVKFGSVSIRDVVVEQSAADAVDLDWVEGEVRGARFEGMGPGGDGLDLSGSRVEVADTVFSGAGDKCISVGERSSVSVRASLLRGCALGVASKDLSTTEIRDAVFLDNERDLAAYQKKAIFGGGRLHGERLVLAGARREPEHDAVSTLELGDAVRADAAAALAPLKDASAFSSEAFGRVWSALR